MTPVPANAQRLLRQTVLMNLGFLGLQVSFGLQQRNMRPIYSDLGADEAAPPPLSLAGPMTGLLVKSLVVRPDGRCRPGLGQHHGQPPRDVGPQHPARAHRCLLTGVKARIRAVDGRVEKQQVHAAKHALQRAGQQGLQVFDQANAAEPALRAGLGPLAGEAPKALRGWVIV